MRSDDENLQFVLPPPFRREVEEAVRRGEFPSVDHALRDALQIWQRRRHATPTDLATIRQRLRLSLDDPRPDVEAAEVERHLDDLHARTKARQSEKA